VNTHTVHDIKRPFLTKFLQCKRWKYITCFV